MSLDAAVTIWNVFCVKRGKNIYVSVVKKTGFCDMLEITTRGWWNLGFYYGHIHIVSPTNQNTSNGITKFQQVTHMTQHVHW